jgi:hypothetical protein
MSDTRNPVMATLRRMGLRTLVRIGIDPGRALTNAQPTTKELTDGRAEQLAYIRQRMIEVAEHPPPSVVRVRLTGTLTTLAGCDPLTGEHTARSQQSRRPRARSGF